MRGKQYSINISAENNLSLFKQQFFDYIEEAEWAIEVCKEFHLPIASTMAIGPGGDWGNVSAADCAVRMSKAGAIMVGTNCRFDLTTTLETLSLMKEGLEKAQLLNKPTFLMAQPLGYHAPDATTKYGWES